MLGQILRSYHILDLARIGYARLDCTPNLNEFHAYSVSIISMALTRVSQQVTWHMGFISPDSKDHTALVEVIGCT